MTVTYTIYHIPNFQYKDGRVGKIGCTTNFPGRIKQLGADGLRVFVLERLKGLRLEVEKQATARERHWQHEFGYRLDSNPYTGNWSNSMTPKQRVAAGMAAVRSMGRRKLRGNGLTASRINRINGSGSYFNRDLQSSNGKKGGAITAAKMKKNGTGFYDRKICSIGGKIGSLVSNAKPYMCPHCRLKGKGSAMIRWHFDNCKQNRGTS